MIPELKSNMYRVQNLGFQIRVKHGLVRSKGLNTKLLQFYLCIFPLSKITKTT